MKVVTYDAGQGPRVGVLDGDAIARRRVRRRHDRVHRGRRAGERRRAAWTGARLLAPLRPRTLRDFLAFEGHLKNVYRNLGRDIPQEWGPGPRL